MTYEEQIQNKNILNIGIIYYNNKKKEFSGGSCYPECGKINLIGDIEEIYQYQGIDTPTEFIAEENTERDYYTKIETNKLLDKKQDKLIAGENIKIDDNNKISATGGSGESLWEVDPNSPNIIQPKEKRIITSNNTRIVDIADPTQPQDAINLRTLDKKLEDKMDKDQFKYAFAINTIGTEIPNLETTNKTIIGAINEILEKQPQPSPSGSNWKDVGTKKDNKTIEYNFIKNKKYCIYYNYSITTNDDYSSWISKEFIFSGSNNTEYIDSFIYTDGSYTWLQLNQNSIFMTTVPYPFSFGKILKLEELQE